MGQYSSKGIYAGYDKNHKERDKDDFYATPPKEAYNILKTLDIDTRCEFFDPCCGRGDLLAGVCDYVVERGVDQHTEIHGTDFKVRDPQPYAEKIPMKMGEWYDFLADDYPVKKVDGWIVMNPPFKLLEPFILRSLEIATRGVICFARIQALEGVRRWNDIWSYHKPTTVFPYVERVACSKGGDWSINQNAIQMHCWIVFDLQSDQPYTDIQWIHKYK